MVIVMMAILKQQFKYNEAQAGSNFIMICFNWVNFKCDYNSDDDDNADAVNDDDDDDSDNTTGP